MAPEPRIVHASSVAFDDQAVLILGESGSGKSSLALELIALGARLVADDRTIVTRDGNGLRAERPATLPGLIEIRGVGLLKAELYHGAAPICLVVDLDRIAAERLPEPLWYRQDGCRVAMLHKVTSRCFPAAIRQYVLHGPSQPD